MSSRLVRAHGPDRGLPRCIERSQAFGQRSVDQLGMDPLRGGVPACVLSAAL